IYSPFSTEQISGKIASMLKADDIHTELQVIYQTIEGLHKAIPNHKGDWYFTGKYPTPGGNKVANRSLINFVEKIDQRAY
ncbi:MAG: amidophosphoribosyltransferase, partial [Flavobacteriales bacterium]